MWLFFFDSHLLGLGLCSCLPKSVKDETLISAFLSSVLFLITISTQFLATLLAFISFPFFLKNDQVFVHILQRKYQRRASESRPKVEKIHCVRTVESEHCRFKGIFCFRTEGSDQKFHKLLRIGEGGFGTVYKGMIKPRSGEQEPTTVVAIKKLDPQGWQGHKQWIAEIQYLGVLNHTNLVKLFGYCSSDGQRGIQRLLVYEYMPNRSLEDHLFNKAKPTIPWITRLRIILGAARGMAYLHEGLQVQVIYRDFKSSNVLLDKEFNAKLSDFGLAREGPTGDRSHVSTAPIGTRGYAAPEYLETGRLTIKSDIWSFGVVVYEIITGRRTLERNLPLAEQKLIEWVRQFPPHTKKFDMIMDRRLQNQYSPSSARTMAKLADGCLNKNPKDRPAMSQVVEILNQVVMQEESVDITNQ